MSKRGPSPTPQNIAPKKTTLVDVRNTQGPHNVWNSIVEDVILDHPPDTPGDTEKRRPMPNDSDPLQTVYRKEINARDGRQLQDDGTISITDCNIQKQSSTIGESFWPAGAKTFSKTNDDVVGVTRERYMTYDKRAIQALTKEERAMNEEWRNRGKQLESVRKDAVAGVLARQKDSAQHRSSVDKELEFEPPKK